MQEKLKVLVADDNETLAKNMQAIIAKNSRVEKVGIAYDGEDAVIQIMNLEPDIVFTDMQMPKRTGIEVIETIKYYPSVPKKPKYILVTADRDSSIFVKARELEFDIEFKPITVEKINQYIDEFVPTETEDEIEEIRKESFLKKLFKKK